MAEKVREGKREREGGRITSGKKSFPAKNPESSGNELAMVTAEGLIQKASAGDRWQPSREGNRGIWYQKKKTEIKIS